ncbi:HU family DNA-binding protein [bacterium]|nr:MAG: HU family DNA-binding protein [bacterium]
MPDKISNAKDLARSIAQKLDMPQEDVETVLREFQSTIVQQMKEGGEVRFPGFGSFKTVKRAARSARNPRTGEKVEVPSHTAVRFALGKSLKSLGDDSS